MALAETKNEGKVITLTLKSNTFGIYYITHFTMGRANGAGWNGSGSV